MKSTAVLILVLCIAGLHPAQAKYQAGSAGEVQVRYGMPIYRDALIEQARPGIEWRMGANGPTVMETTAALVMKKGIIFPGTYTLTASCKDESAWDLLFKEGVQQGRGRGDERSGDRLPSLELARTKLEKEELHTKKLEIELKKAKDKAQAKMGGAEFELRFGPHQLAGNFLCVGTTKKSYKLDKIAFELESLKLPLQEEYEAVLLGKGDEPLSIARITLTKEESVSLVELVPGEEPTLRFPAWNRTINGKRSTGQSKASTLEVALKSKTLVIKLGTTALEFELDAAALGKAETGGTTPDK